MVDVQTAKILPLLGGAFVLFRRPLFVHRKLCYATEVHLRKVYSARLYDTKFHCDDTSHPLCKLTSVNLALDSSFTMQPTHFIKDSSDPFHRLRFYYLVRTKISQNVCVNQYVHNCLIKIRFLTTQHFANCFYMHVVNKIHTTSSEIRSI